MRYYFRSHVTKSGDEIAYWYDAQKNINGKWEYWRQIIRANGSVEWEEPVQRSKRSDAKRLAEKKSQTERQIAISKIGAKATAFLKINYSTHYPIAAKLESRRQSTKIAQIERILLMSNEVMIPLADKKLGPGALICLIGHNRDQAVFDGWVLKTEIAEWLLENSKVSVIKSVKIGGLVNAKVLEFTSASELLSFVMVFNGAR